MKKTLLSIFSFVLLSSFALGQSFSDDFESYNVGDYLGESSPQWTTWSGTTGTTEDVRITDASAASGTKSIKFASTATNGGPQDVVLFYGGDKLTSGFLNTKMKMLVETGAYFNYQAETEIGVTWAMNAFFEAGGSGRITGSSNASILTFDYPIGEWFEFEMNINFDANKWQLNVNGVCVGSFASATNSIASIDIFPVQGNSFFVDDFAYTYSEVSPEIKDDISTSLTASRINGLVGNEIGLEGSITNEGTTVLNSFEGNIIVGSETIPFSQEGLALSQGEKYNFIIDDKFELPEGFTAVDMVVSLVNEGNFSDEDLCNNEASLILFGTLPADHKKVIVEEATGTWCGWCPRGTVWMDRMTNRYPDHFIGIAVHSGDPMEDVPYSDGLAAGSFPGAKVNRGGFIDPSSIESPFLTDIRESSSAILEHGALWDDASRELTISLTVTSILDISTGYKVNVALTEDDVTGTGNGYGQENYYSGGDNLIGDDGVNWADLPATVPASQMEYDHVARAILAPFEGLANSFESKLSTDEQKSFNFTYTIPAGFDETKMHIVTMLINPNGSINTGESTSIMEAVDNGFVLVSSTHSIELDNATSVYPNPMSDYTTVDINLVERTDVNINIVDMSGRFLMQKTYKGRNGFFRTNVNTSDLPVGNYIMKINTNDFYATKKIAVVR